MSEEPNLVGMMLGSYRISGELSRGGMGTVYRAQHAVLERAVAIKVLRPELTTNQELVVRFVNEAKAASAIRHPGIIEVLDFGHAHDGRAYLVMEFLDGESLAQRITKRGRLTPGEAAEIARGIAGALTAAHKKGIVHRDLKPDNVMLVPDLDAPAGERTKLLDFGIAKLGDLSQAHVKYTQTGALIGTPLYMAPEQARAAGGIDHRADLYSLGCMMYEMLVGQPPFVAVGAGEIIALQLFGTAEPPSRRGEGISDALDRIVMRLLDKDPDARFQSAAELADALGSVFGCGGVRPAPELPTAVAIAKPPLIAPTELGNARRATRWIWALAAATLVAAIVTFVATREQTTPTPAPVPRDPPPVETKATTPAPPVETRATEQPAPTEAPAATEAAPVAPPPVAPVAPPPVTPVKRGRPRDQTGSATPPKHTKHGSPIETDVD